MATSHRRRVSKANDAASQTERAVLALREILLRGDFAAGQRLTELTLVARLGASRTPVRHALNRLAHEGLLEELPAGGFSVRQFTLADIWDAIEIRGVLEGTAARLAAERLVDDSELEPLRHQCRQMDTFERLTIDSFAEYMDMNEAFHNAFVALSKSRMLGRHLDQVKSLPFASPSAMVFPTSFLPKSDETLAIALAQHRDIVEAIETRQGTRAESIAREHAYVARHVLERALSNTDALSRVPGGSLINVTPR